MKPVDGPDASEMYKSAPLIVSRPFEEEALLLSLDSGSALLGSVATITYQEAIVTRLESLNVVFKLAVERPATN